jgi:hypothetical protein
MIGNLIRHVNYQCPPSARNIGWCCTISSGRHVKIPSGGNGIKHFPYKEPNFSEAFCYHNEAAL